MRRARARRRDRRGRGGRAIAGALADEPALPRDMRAWLRQTLAAEPWPHILGDVTRPRRPDRRRARAAAVRSRASASPTASTCASRSRSPRSPRRPGSPGTTGCSGTSTIPRPATSRSRSSPDRRSPGGTCSRRRATGAASCSGSPGGRTRRAGSGRTSRRSGPGVRFAYNDVRTNLLLAGAHARARTVARGGAARAHHGADRRAARAGAGAACTACGRPADGAASRRDRRQPLGRRLVGLRARSRPLRAPAPARRRVGRPPAALLGVVRARCASRARCDPPTGSCGGATSGRRRSSRARHREQVVWCDPERDLVAVVRWVRDRRSSRPHRGSARAG